MRAAAAQIEAYCGNVERATGAQFAIVTVDSLEDEPVEDVAVRLFKEWGIGKKGTDEGLLVLLAIKDHKNRVEVGYGLEPVISDGYAGGVLRGIRPILRQGNYGGALLAAAQQFGQRIAEAKGVTHRRPAVRQTSAPANRGRRRRILRAHHLLRHPDVHPSRPQRTRRPRADAAAAVAWAASSPACFLGICWAEDAGEAGAAADSAEAAELVAAAEAVDSAASAEAVQAAEVLPVAGDNAMDELLKELVTKLEHAFSDRLVSVILYGSAASPEHARPVLRSECFVRAEAGDASRADGRRAGSQMVARERASLRPC